jgi:hypothetical protein
MGRTLLMFAAPHNRLKAAEELLKAGANPDVISAQGSVRASRPGCSALMLAAASGWAEMVKLLLEVRLGRDEGGRGEGDIAGHRPGPTIERIRAGGRQPAVTGPPRASPTRTSVPFVTLRVRAHATQCLMNSLPAAGVGQSRNDQALNPSAPAPAQAKAAPDPPILSAGGNVGWSALNAAAAAGHLECVSLLMHAGARSDIVHPTTGGRALCLPDALRARAVGIWHDAHVHNSRLVAQFQSHRRISPSG